MYNFLVDDVDAEYQQLSKAGMTISISLEDHPWGERGFAVQDPDDITLYICSKRETNKEFKEFY